MNLPQHKQVTKKRQHYEKVFTGNACVSITSQLSRVWLRFFPIPPHAGIPWWPLWAFWQCAKWVGSSYLTMGYCPLTFLGKEKALSCLTSVPLSVPRLAGENVFITSALEQSCYQSALPNLRVTCSHCRPVPRPRSIQHWLKKQQCELFTVDIRQDTELRSSLPPGNCAATRSSWTQACIWRSLKTIYFLLCFSSFGGCFPLIEMKFIKEPLRIIKKNSAKWEGISYNRRGAVTHLLLLFIS